MNKNELGGSSEPLRSNVGDSGILGERSGLSLEKIRSVGQNLGEQIEEQLAERPYVVLGAVAGVGFVAGALVGSRLGQIAVAIAGGYLIRNAIRSQGGDVQKLVKQGIDKLTSERSTA
jgi:hypothetical protein